MCVCVCDELAPGLLAVVGSDASEFRSEYCESVADVASTTFRPGDVADLFVGNTGGVASCELFEAHGLVL